ncbi:MAG: hypothetical protein KIT81_01335 [Alphaproteobacteria bacterium]|nr:hypothetical protein [Alphaproteobacteria bacterium]
MRVLFWFPFLLFLLTGCMAYGPADNPVQRNFTWFSYVAAEDIRANCGPGAPERWRFVYNGIYGEQVRFYDITLDPRAGGSAMMEARVKGRGDLLELDLFDPLRPWSGPFARRFLAEAQWLDLDRALGPDGIGSRTRPGTRLRSDNFYWVAAACRAGQFYHRAWQQPEDDLNRLRFVPILLAYDPTGVPFNAPRRLYLGPFSHDGGLEGGPHDEFQLTVGADGLIAVRGF